MDEDRETQKEKIRDGWRQREREKEFKIAAYIA